MGAGSAHEADSETGTAHFLEHMLFKGTERRDGVLINDEIENLGGNINAFTSFDHTAYHAVLPSQHWRHGLDILLDMLFHSRLEKTDMEIERRVVLEEIKEGADSPETVLGEKLFAQMYPDHPYGRAVISDTETILRIQLDILKSYYRKWYQPKNMVLSVAGNVDWNSLVEAVREMTNGLTVRTEEYLSIPESIPPKDLVYLALNCGTEERIVEVGFPIPGVHHPDIPALEVLSVILGGGEMSRLYRKIRHEKDLTRSISTNLFVPLKSGRFLVHALPYEGKELDLFKELLNQIQFLQNDRVSFSELNRAKLILEKEFIFHDETIEGRARSLGYFQLTFGSFEQEQEYRNEVMTVTPSKIKDVTQAYLRSDYLGFGLLVPMHEKPPSLEDVKKFTDISIYSNIRSQRKKGRCGDITFWKTATGIRVICHCVSDTPVSTVYAAMLGGLWTETECNNGISGLIASTLDCGTQNRSQEYVAQETTYLQSEIEGLTGKNFQALQLDSIHQNFLQALELFGDVLLHPSFRGEHVFKEKLALLRELKSQEDYFELKAANIFAERMFPGHPYGLNILGNQQSVEKLESKDLKDHYQSILRPEGLVLGIAGDFDSELLKDKLEEIFEDFAGSEKTVDSPKLLQPLSDITEVRRPIEGEKAYISYGFRGTTLKNEDRYALEVLSAILASSGGGRLYVKLREELGIVYSLDTSVMHGLTEGYFAINLNTTPDQVEQAYDEIQKELRRLKSDGLSEEEILRVKNFLIGTYDIELQRSGAKACQLCLSELYGTEHSLKDYPRKISKVTIADVQEVADRYLTLDKAVYILLSPSVH